MEPMIKYPRTRHLSGSGLQPGDEDLTVASYQELIGQPIVIEEKMDGANAGISFGRDGTLLLQSRGHYLTGGPREQQFALLKSWAHRYAHELWDLLQDRYIMYGEWMYAKHTVFYTDLPHYFLEFDIYDKQAGIFLSTARRREFLARAPFVVSVRVLYEGIAPRKKPLADWIGSSPFIAVDHLEKLRHLATQLKLQPELAIRETDHSGLMEGLYIKVEEHGRVKNRYKWVRSGFLQTIIDSESHWMNRPLIPNQLRKGVSLF
ncbi:RNA ligase family protein [Laceyella putida]|uniref:RNA ligase family protein n=1 Tax=Laceyella putida TaxID=110101 RepID=A0ABW2RKL4_9BACL